jgi:hypothetical protein
VCVISHSRAQIPSCQQQARGCEFAHFTSGLDARWRKNHTPTILYVHFLKMVHTYCLWQELAALQVQVRGLDGQKDTLSQRVSRLMTVNDALGVAVDAAKRARDHARGHASVIGGQLGDAKAKVYCVYVCGCAFT